MIKIDDAYRNQVKESVDSHLDWMENALNGRIRGKAHTKPLWYEDSMFELVIRPVRLSQDAKDKLPKISLRRAFDRAISKLDKNKSQ